MRSCGACNACCVTHKVNGVSGLAYPHDVKPCGQACSHLHPGKRTRRCRVYETRPAGCRTFQCLWLAGILPEHMRPDRKGVGVVLDVDGVYEDVDGAPTLREHIVKVWELYQGAASNPLVRETVRVLVEGQGVPVFVMHKGCIMEVHAPEGSHTERMIRERGGDLREVGFLDTHPGGGL